MINRNKTTHKTFLILSIIPILLVLGGIILVHATSGNLLLEINNYTPSVYDLFGSSVASTADGNILVGAWNNDNTGSVYLVDGNDGSLLLTINNPTPEVSDNFGISVASITNGNILVGASRDNTNALDTGSAYIFDGNDGSLLLTINNPTPEPSDRFGWSVTGTTNGNILIGAHLDDTNALDTGSVYLFDGNDGSLLLTINNPIPESRDNFGYSVASITNGNILVGERNDNTSFVYLFDGNDGGLLLTINNPTPESGDSFGASVAGIIDDNILIGAFGDNTGADDTGSAYLFDGNDGSLLLTINNPTPEVSDNFGYSVASTTNGNILVGAFRDNTGADNTGSVYLFEGITSFNNTAPVLDPIPNQSIYEDDLLVFLVNATDVDLDPISFGINPLLNFTSFVDNGNDTATFSANPGFTNSGVYNFNVTASDGIDTTWQVFTLTVNNVAEILPTITVFELFNNPSNGQPSALKDLSVGSNPYLGNNTLIHGNIEFRSNANNTQLDNIELQILENGKVTAVAQLNSTTHTALTGITFNENQTISYTGGNVLFVLSESEKINPSQEASLTLRINATTSFGSSLLEDYSNTVEKLVHYTADNRYGDRVLDANNCYGSNILCGGDDWVRPSFKIIFENFTGIVYNDFSNMNGGYFPPHKSHRLGEDVDVKFEGGENGEFTVNADSAQRLMDYLNDPVYGKYIDKTFVTFNPEFEQEIKDVTLDDGCKVEDYIKNEIDHTDHFHWRLSLDQRICPSSDVPVIISLIADDPDDLDNVYSRSDTITITFDSDTNTPGGTSVQRKPVVDDMFTFTESLGRAYSGKWTAPDTFTITIKSVNDAGPPIISGTTVTPSGTTPILSIDETSDPSFVMSSILSGDFGIP